MTRRRLLTDDRMDDLRRTPRQADVSDVEDLVGEVDRLRAEILAARHNGSAPEAFWLPDADGNTG
jgi:hypothetical protein